MQSAQLPERRRQHCELILLHVQGVKLAQSAQLGWQHRKAHPRQVELALAAAPCLRNSIEGLHESRVRFLRHSLEPRQSLVLAERQRTERTRALQRSLLPLSTDGAGKAVRHADYDYAQRTHAVAQCQLDLLAHDREQAGGQASAMKTTFQPANVSTPAGCWRHAALPVVPCCELCVDAGRSR